MQIQLKENYSLTVEPHLKTGVRIVVNERGNEVACRKETFKNLLHFLQNEGRIFKGRIQLDKHNNNVAVELKGELIGSVAAETLFDMLQQQPNFKKEFIQ